MQAVRVVWWGSNLGPRQHSLVECTTCAVRGAMAEPPAAGAGKETKDKKEAKRLEEEEKRQAKLREETVKREAKQKEKEAKEREKEKEKEQKRLEKEAKEQEAREKARTDRPHASLGISHRIG